jgi:hypothetical protein
LVILHRFASFQHRDQQRGAGRLDGEQNADAAVARRAGAQFQQALWPRR